MHTIEIEDFKCFGNLNSIHLNQLTVLAGMNSAGKSSFIQALKLLHSASNSDGEELNYNGDAPDCGFGSVHELINFESGANEFSIRLYDDATDDMVGACFMAKDDEDDALTLTFSTVEEGRPELIGEEIYYLSAERLGPRTSMAMVDLPYLHCGPRGEFTAQVLAHKGGFTKVDAKRWLPKTTNGNLDAQTKEWLNFILPNTAISVREDKTLMRSQVLIDRRNRELHKATNVGFGVSYLLPVITECLVAKSNRLVIIENPEAHLHPSAQTKVGWMLGFMANAGLTIIIETHSEHVIEGIQLFAAENRDFRGSISINFFSECDDSNAPDIREITLNRKDLMFSDFPKGFLDESAKTFNDFRLALRQGE